LNICDSSPDLSETYLEFYESIFDYRSPITLVLFVTG
jgi:hypothetical protein